MHEFPNKSWSVSRLDNLIKKIDDTGVQTVIMIVVGRNWPPNSPDLNPALWITAFWKICHKECINYKHQRAKDMQHLKDLL